MAGDKIETPEEEEQERFIREHAEERLGAAWYYRAREGMFGPFESRDAAEADLARLIYTNPKKREQFLK